MTERAAGESGPRRPTASGRKAAPDPLGRRALFWVPGQAHAEPSKATKRVPLGKHAFFSSAPGPSASEAEISENPLANQGPLVVTCSACHTVTRVGLLDFVIYQFPFPILLPGRRFDRRMTCPTCRRRVWASVTLQRG